MKRLFTYLILFSLAIVTVPREWVHDCEHDSLEHAKHDQDDNHDSDAYFSQDDCFACDYDLSTATFSVDGLGLELPVHTYRYVACEYSEYTFFFPNSDLLRGPPSVELS